MARDRASWRVAGVSARGFAHEEKDEPCQDSHAIEVLKNGWLVAAVCDGAGSTLHGGEGAGVAADGVVRSLASKVRPKPIALPNGPNGKQVLSWVTEAVADVRKRLNSTAKQRGLTITDFHATLVGCLVDHRGGWFFQIGDGAGLAATSPKHEQFTLSSPENGQFAETTYFLTEDTWTQHLRLTPFGPEHDLILLMSDGVTGMALKGPTTALSPVLPFVEPINRYLQTVDRISGEAALAATLSSEKVRDITGDDKTLVWASRSRG